MLKYVDSVLFRPEHLCCSPILCQITSRSYASKRALPIGAADFARGALPMDSFARPDKLFTASESIAVSVLGTLAETRLRDIRQSVAALFQD